MRGIKYITLMLIFILVFVSCGSGKTTQNVGNNHQSGSGNTTTAEYRMPSEVLRWNNVKNALNLQDNLIPVVEYTLSALGTETFTDIDITYQDDNQGTAWGYVELYVKVPFDDAMKEKVINTLKSHGISNIDTRQGRRYVAVGSFIVRREDNNTSLIKVPQKQVKIPVAWDKLKGAVEWNDVVKILNKANIDNHYCFTTGFTTKDISIFASGNYISVNIEYAVENGSCASPMKKAVSEFAKKLGVKLGDGVVKDVKVGNITIKYYGERPNDDDNPSLYMVIIFKPRK